MVKADAPKKATCEAKASRTAEKPYNNLGYLYQINSSMLESFDIALVLPIIGITD